MKTVTSVTGRCSQFSRPAAHGFTLLELLAAITIAAIVLGVSAPAVQRFYQSSQYHGAVRDVVSQLNAARYRAISQGDSVDVLFYPESGEVSVRDRTTTLPGSLAMEVLGSAEYNREGAGVIRFFPDGGSSGGFVNLAHDNGMSVQVQVDWLLGRITLCQENCDDTSA